MGEVHQNITGNEYADQIAMLELAHTHKLFKNKLGNIKNLYRGFS